MTAKCTVYSTAHHVPHTDCARRLSTLDDSKPFCPASSFIGGKPSYVRSLLISVVLAQAPTKTYRFLFSQAVQGSAQRGLVRKDLLDFLEAAWCNLRIFCTRDCPLHPCTFRMRMLTNHERYAVKPISLNECPIKMHEVPCQFILPESRCHQGRYTGGN